MALTRDQKIRLLVLQRLGLLTPREKKEMSKFKKLAKQQ